MKTKGRPQSSNIDDQRNYFGTNALDKGYSDEDRMMDFLVDALQNPQGLLPQKLEQRAPATIEEIIQHEMTKGIPYPEYSPNGSFGMIDKILGAR